MVSVKARDVYGALSSADNVYGVHSNPSAGGSCYFTVPGVVTRRDLGYKISFASIGGVHSYSGLKVFA